jgi:23S rRNA (uracil1939-C5)-methyltransferase
MRADQQTTVEIEQIALGGKGLARVEGRVVFVDRGLPGDLARVRLTRVKGTWAEARLEAVERPSAERRAPLCPHTERCGGCRMQELPYPRQLETKQRHVEEALRHLGGIAEPRVRPIVGAAETERYRNKMEFSFAPDAEGLPALGLHDRGHFDRVFELADCVLPSPLTVGIVRLTQRFARQRGWRAYHPRLHDGLVRFLTVRHLPLTGECGVHLVAARDEVPAISEWAAAVAALSPEVRTVTLLVNDSRANIAFGGAERLLLGDGRVRERLLGLEFEAGANAFLQTNSRQAERLYAAALEAARLAGSEQVLDLYCGTGTLTLLFARACREAIGVESVADAIAAAHANAGRNGIANVRFEEGESRAVLREWAQGRRLGRPAPEVVVVDPPRAGLHPRVVFRVAELAPARIVYVSCNPATLARDLKDFATHGYTLDEVTPFDLFPHTPHIECVARLVPAAG